MRLKTWFGRTVIWGDRRHWELRIRRFNVYRWCSGRPCHLPGRKRMHLIKVQYLRRRYSVLDRR